PGACNRCSELTGPELWPVIVCPLAFVSISLSPIEVQAVPVTSSLHALPAVSGLDQLLAAIDIVGSAREGGVCHDVDGECGDIGGPDDASDRQCGAELVATFVESVAEQRRRQWCVDEAWRD